MRAKKKLCVVAGVYNTRSLTERPVFCFANSFTNNSDTPLTWGGGGWLFWQQRSR